MAEPIDKRIDWAAVAVAGMWAPWHITEIVSAMAREIISLRKRVEAIEGGGAHGS